MLLITNAIAQRLEMAEAVDAAGCAEAQCRIDASSNAASKAIAGGVAVYCGGESPLTHSVGIGMHGPVTTDDLDELEAFFQQRGSPVVVDLCPHADTSLAALVSSRGYRIAEFINVMVRLLSPDQLLPDAPLPEPSPVVIVRKAEPDEDELFVKTVIGGFFSRDRLTEQEIRLGATLFHMPCSSGYLAYIDGQAVGGGGMSVRNRVASLFGDATHPGFRGRGVHSNLIRARINAAQHAGCDLISAGTAPGAASQRNYEKLGFRVAYTKLTMVLE
jgi:GNAT superfamily N-acetyltransferase